jgi:ATP-binding cassette subfamily A (ABC1) protein 3
MKRILYFKRDTRGFVCEVFLPIVIVVAGLSILLIDFIYSSPPIELTADLYSTPLDTVFSGNYKVFPSDTIKKISEKFNTEDFKPELYNSKNSLKNFDDY